MHHVACLTQFCVSAILFCWTAPLSATGFMLRCMQHAWQRRPAQQSVRVMLASACWSAAAGAKADCVVPTCPQLNTLTCPQGTTPQAAVTAAGAANAATALAPWAASACLAAVCQTHRVVDTAGGTAGGVCSADAAAFNSMWTYLANSSDFSTALAASAAKTSDLVAACNAAVGEDCLAPLFTACPALARPAAGSAEVAVLSDDSAAKVCTTTCIKAVCEAAARLDRCWRPAAVQHVLWALARAYEKTANCPAATAALNRPVSLMCNQVGGRKSSLIYTMHVVDLHDGGAVRYVTPAIPIMQLHGLTLSLGSSPVQSCNRSSSAAMTRVALAHTCCMLAHVLLIFSFQHLFLTFSTCSLCAHSSWAPPSPGPAHPSPTSQGSRAPYRPTQATPAPTSCCPAATGTSQHPTSCRTSTSHSLPLRRSRSMTSSRCVLGICLVLYVGTLACMRGCASAADPPRCTLQRASVRAGEARVGATA